MKKERRWLKSVIAASEGAQPSLPWTRGNRRKPEAVKATAAKPATAPQAVAAR